MFYLSELLKKPLLKDDRNYAKVIDFGMSQTLQTHEVSTFVILKNKQKYNLPVEKIELTDKAFILKKDAQFLPYDDKQFYLNEDLLDKQVIDITGKRLVRVNDVLLKQTLEGLKVLGIDIGFSGILRRLGLSALGNFKTITIPWSTIEAFDYQTGTVRIKLSQSNLNTFHPSEIAEILEEAGSKERQGVVEALDAQKAARALEEANEETQQSILEELPTNQLKRVIGRMPISEIADVLTHLNPLTVKEVFSLLGHEKSQKVKKLLVYKEDVAGGLMSVSFWKANQYTKVGSMLSLLAEKNDRPEGIVVLDEAEKVAGAIYSKDLINVDLAKNLGDIMRKTKTVNAEAPLEEIIKLFANYNLRILPVVDHEEKPLGIIPIDAVLERIEEEEETEDAL